MRAYSYISAAALAAALIATPQIAQAQLLGVDVDVGGDAGSVVDAGVTIGGGSDAGGSLVDADVNVGGSSGSDSGSGGSLVDVDVNSGGATSGSGAGNGLLDVNIGNGGATGPNGGTLIDLNVGRTDAALVDAEVDVGSGSGAAATPAPSSALINGDVRIGALGQGSDRTGALLRLIDSPNLAEIDLDAAIDDRRVAIVSAAELLGADGLADIEAAITTGGDGRTELLDALSASVELGAILGNQGIDLDDIVAVQVAENGATEVIVLGDTARVAALGDNGNLADLTAADAADLDIDLLSRDELAEIDLDLLPDDLRSTAQLRLLGVDSPAAEPTPAELAAVDLDLLSNDELAELDLTLLPAPVRTAIQARILADDGNLADLSVGDLAAIDLDLLPAGSDDDDAAGGGGAPGEDDGSDDGDSGSGAGGDTGGGSGSDTDGSDTGSDTGSGSGSGNGSGSDTNGSGNADDGADGNGAIAETPSVGVLPATPVDATFGVAALDCSIGVLALASGAEASPQAIATADSLELVSIDGCARSLVDAEVAEIRAAISANPAISGVLAEAQIPLDSVIGATIQGGVLTVFIEPAVG